jgi:hypothetical protein
VAHVGKPILSDFDGGGGSGVSRGQVRQGQSASAVRLEDQLRAEEAHLLKVKLTSICVVTSTGLSAV